jgi:uncharacterized protein
MQSIFTANRIALITGASAGIGLELAKVLAPRVDSLILVARRIERLEQLATELRSRYSALKIAVEAADLADPESLQNLLRRLEEGRWDVDVLINNAGLGEFGLFESSPWSRIQQMIDVNILAMLRLSHSLLPGMIRRGHGAILNIGSGAGYSAMPNAAVYTASKHFVRAFTESLRAQLAGTPITVSEAAPGPVESEFDQVAGVEGTFLPGQRFLQITAQECATDIMRQFERGSQVIFPGRNFRWLMRMQPLQPRRLLARLLAQEAGRIRKRDTRVGST